MFDFQHRNRVLFDSFKVIFSVQVSTNSNVTWNHDLPSPFVTSKVFPKQGKETVVKHCLYSD